MTQPNQIPDGKPKRRMQAIKYVLILAVAMTAYFLAAPYINPLLVQVFKFVPLALFVGFAGFFTISVFRPNPNKKLLLMIYMALFVSYFTASPYDLMYMMFITFAALTVLFAVKAFKYFLFALGIVAIYCITAPFAHPYLFKSIKYMPSVVFAAATIVCAVMAIRSKANKKRVMIWSILAVFAPVLSITTYLTNTHPMIIEWQLGKAVNAEKLASLPYTVNSRLVARPTARMFLENATADNRVQVGKPHLALIKTPEGKRKLVWRAGLEGTVYYYKWLDSVTGVVSIEAGQTQQVIAEKAIGGKAFFLMGHKSPLVDAVLKIRHPLSKRGNTLYWQKDNGEWVFLVSYWSYRPTPTLTMVPYLDGVMEFSNMGTFSSHSIESAAESFAGASLYPPDLMELYGDAYSKYHDGLWNFYVAQKDILEIAEEAKTGDDTVNQFPFYQEFKDLGLQLVLPFEPYGAGRSALQRILLFDAITGKARVYIVPEGKENELSSPRIAIMTADNAAPDAMWSTYDIEEPVLSHEESGTYWLLKVIKKNKSNPASVFIVLVKADQPHALTAIAFKSREELDQFMNSKSVALQKLHEAATRTQH